MDILKYINITEYYAMYPAGSGKVTRRNSIMARRKDDPAKILSIKFIMILLAVWTISLTISGCSKTPESPAPVPARRILFIGNSYTGFNDGVDKHLGGLAPQIVAGRIAPGGVSLEGHWRNSDTLHIIRTGKWDVVILQEQSQTPVINTKIFSEYAGKLNEEIKKTGAQTILFMTWERPDSIQFGVTTANLSTVFAEVGQQLDVVVAPVGVAFFKAAQERPDLRLNSLDGHPTLQGTYLAACVFYGMIFEKTPAGNAYSAGLNEADKAFLQKIAAQSLGY